jgi:hypothetical protein
VVLQSPAMFLRNSNKLTHDISTRKLRTNRTVGPDQPGRRRGAEARSRQDGEQEGKGEVMAVA